MKRRFWRIWYRYFSRNKKVNCCLISLGVIICIVLVGYLFSHLNDPFTTVNTSNVLKASFVRSSSACRPSGTIHRQYACCNFEPVPYVANMLETAQFLRLSNNSLARFGDGEIKLLRGEDIGWQDPDAELIKRMDEIFLNPLPTLSIGLPSLFSGYTDLGLYYMHYYYEDPQYRNYLASRVRTDAYYLLTHITSPFTHSEHSYCMPLTIIFNNLREIWRDKDIVLLRGNNSQIYDYDVYDTAHSQVVLYAPRDHAWKEYHTLKQELMKQDPNALYILTAGPTAKVLVYDMALAGRRALDMGHLAKDYNAWKHNKHPKLFYTD